jgi:hypothetical protein
VTGTEKPKTFATVSLERGRLSLETSRESLCINNTEHVLLYHSSLSSRSLSATGILRVDIRLDSYGQVSGVVVVL